MNIHELKILCDLINYHSKAIIVRIHPIEGALRIAYILHKERTFPMDIL